MNNKKKKPPQQTRKQQQQHSQAPCAQSAPTSPPRTCSDSHSAQNLDTTTAGGPCDVAPCRCSASAGDHPRTVCSTKPSGGHRDGISSAMAKKMEQRHHREHMCAQLSPSLLRSSHSLPVVSAGAGFCRGIDTRAMGCAMRPASGRLIIDLVRV